MSSSSNNRKGAAFRERARRAGPLPFSMMAVAEPVEHPEQEAASPPPASSAPSSDPIARRVAEQMIGGLPPARPSKDSDRINRLAVQLHELKALDKQRLLRHG